MFFRDLGQDIYPTSAILSMKFVAPSTRDANDGYYFVELSEDRSCRISYEEARSLERLRFQYVPAFPGTTLLEVREDRSANDPFHRSAVLAWLVNGEGALHPLTSEGISEVSSWAVKTADGLVSDIFGGSFPDEAAYLASLTAAD